MSTSNFKSMEYGMPLITTKDFSTMKDEFEKNCGEKYDEDLYQIDMDCIYEDMRELSQNINDELEFYKVKIEDGYYEGIQFVVEQEYEESFDLEKGTKYEIDNDDAQYYFGMCRSKVLRKAESERNRIKKWLKNLKKYGYWELNCDGIFSNGEAIYSRI